jgi:hypothetical protein
MRGLDPVDRWRKGGRLVRAYGKGGYRRAFVMRKKCGRQRPRRLASGDDMNGNGEITREDGISERAPDGALGAGCSDAGANDSQGIAPESVDAPGQWALCGSDQADNRVTTSNSRRSFATT